MNDEFNAQLRKLKDHRQALSNAFNSLLTLNRKVHQMTYSYLIGNWVSWEVVWEIFPHAMCEFSDMCNDPTIVNASRAQHSFTLIQSHLNDCHFYPDRWLCSNEVEMFEEISLAVNNAIDFINCVFNILNRR